MKIAVLQFEVEFGDVEANIEHVEKVFLNTNLDNIDTVVLPEMWTTGYDLENIQKLAMDNLEPIKGVIQRLAKKYSVNIIAGSVANTKGEGVLNTSFVVNRDGEFIHEYSKIHLVPMLNEPKYLVGGKNKAEVFELDGEKMGVVICYDLRFPELFRDLALDGAKIIFVVAEWPIERTAHWLTLLQARAIENQCYIVASNIIGKQPTGTEFAGKSIIINPFGEIMNQATSNEEEVLLEQLDMEYINRIRKKIPIFKSRRTNYYKFN
ncbi:carbon-nitrogen family hydrolase [Oceanobacillus aidingensis]|uniref:Carbon-nitrogen family hydrolase n=1 Tax=Oceanobacillus aidingensis TaxID=645964 RepID=A0ABV9JSL6_9BACI